jgi:hypothetical protein
VVLSKREKLIGIVTASMVGAVVLQHFIVGPMLDQRAYLGAQVQLTQGELKKATDVIDLSARANTNWAALSPKVFKDFDDAQSQLLHSIRDCAAETGVSIASINPQRGEPEKDFIKLTFRATGTGQMGQIGRFLNRIQTAAIPIRIADLSINARGREGVDDLSISVAISTIYFAPNADKAARPPAVAQAEAIPAAAAAGGTR